MKNGENHLKTLIKAILWILVALMLIAILAKGLEQPGHDPYNLPEPNATKPETRTSFKI